MNVRIDLRHAATLESVLNDEQVCLIIWTSETACHPSPDPGDTVPGDTALAGPLPVTGSALLAEEALGDLRWGDRQPPVDQRLFEVARRDRVQLDQVCVV